MKEISEESRIWIYQSSRKFNQSEIDYINHKLSAFISQWNNHGNKLNSMFKIIHQQFIVFAVDENILKASGCSIDSSVRIIKEIGRELKIDFFDRMNIAFFINNKVKMIHTKELKQAIERGEINSESLVFNHLIEKKSDLTNNWIVKAKTTWLNRFFS